jgi:pSer/pThr/pTyr-binding forkhead associated (FHA) protein
MLAQVILKVKQGNLTGEEFVFTGRTHCLLGRASGCSLRIPGDDLGASRYHCQLDIDPPVVWVEDLGSLNGTFVNGESIGQRNENASSEEARSSSSLPRLLADGDELRVGGNVFEVSINESPWDAFERDSVEQGSLALTR